MRIAGIYAVLILPGLAATALGQQKLPSETAVRVCAVCQSWEAGDRNLFHVLKMLDRAAAERADIVCLPEECVPTDGGAVAQAALEAIAKVAAARSMMIAVNLKEKDGDKLYSTSYLIGSDGKRIGKYRKSHRLPYESIALGDALPVFDTPLGKIGLMIGSDGYWPEAPLVLALQGAELILWSHGPEPMPQGYSLDVVMRARAFDNQVTLAVANYAGELPYLCSNWPAFVGQPLGRGCVVDRSGIVVADTSMRTGVAAAPIDLGRGSNVYRLTFTEDRSLFRYLVDPTVKPIVHRGQKRKIRVAIAQIRISEGPNPDPHSVFFKSLDEAGSRGPDVILMSEFGFPTDTPEAAQTFAQVAERAKKYNTYVVIGGLRDPKMPDKDGKPTSWAYIWDREGKVIGKYRISQYGGSKDLPVFKTDFGVVGIMLCGDVYSPEIARALALQGAEIIFCPSQSWGPSGQWNLWMQQARAIDNAAYLAVAHFPFSDVSQRSYVIDPYGYPLAASDYWRDSVVVADVDLDAGRTWFAPSNTPGKAGQKGYLAGYYPKTVPEKRTDFREAILAGRRPELYRPIVEETLAGRDLSAETKGDKTSVSRTIGNAAFGGLPMARGADTTDSENNRPVTEKVLDRDTGHGLDCAEFNRQRKLTEFNRLFLDDPGHYIKDHCLVKKNDRYHLFYIRGVRTKDIAEFRDQWIGHASTADFHCWQIHEPLTQEGAPFVIENGGVWYLFYNRDSFRDPRRPIRVATSTDLFHWKTHDKNPVYEPSAKFYRYAAPVRHCRDFHVFREGDWFYLLFCGLTKDGLGCVGLVRSKNLLDWEDLGPLFVLDHSARKYTRCWWSGYGNPESPCLFKKNGWWHLFFTDNSWTQTYHLWSKDMTTGWSWEHAQKLVVNNNGYDSISAATEIVERRAGDLMSYYFWDMEKKTFVLRLTEIGWEGPILYVKY